MDHELLKFIWWLLIGALLIGLVIVEGLDLGARVLLPFMQGQSGAALQPVRPASLPRRIKLLWLLALSCTLSAAWPTVGWLPGLGGLIGVLALRCEPCGQATRSLRTWTAQVIGLMPAMLIGVVLGNLLLGMPFSRCAGQVSHFHGTLSGLLRPFALLVGLVSLSMLCQLGATWAMLRGAGSLRPAARQLACRAGVVFLISFSTAALWLAADLRGYTLAEGGHSAALCMPGQWVVLPGNTGWQANFRAWPAAILAPVLAVGGTILSLCAAARGRAGLAVVASALTITAMLCCVGVALFPFIVPSSVQLSASLTVWNAASGEKMMGMMLIFASVLMPMLLAYTVGAGLGSRNRLSQVAVADSFQHSPRPIL
ncbi:cytochrome d ubiquinol oxidase subunit II [Pseudomonas sp. YQ_5]|uniref:cytochrome d ubiquinol oxidase subunit II n=1 Tax=Pseudomonas sp. YQ_5 TaxID=3367229 RepID=UPI00370BDFD5